MTKANAFEDWIENNLPLDTLEITCETVHPIISEVIKRVNSNTAVELATVPDVMQQAIACLATEFSAFMVANLSQFVTDDGWPKIESAEEMFEYMVLVTIKAISEVSNAFYSDENDVS